VKRLDSTQFPRDSSFSGKQSSDASRKYLPLIRELDGINLLTKENNSGLSSVSLRRSVPKSKHSAEKALLLSRFCIGTRIATEGVNPGPPMASTAMMQNAKRQAKPVPPTEARVSTRHCEDCRKQLSRPDSRRAWRWKAIRCHADPTRSPNRLCSTFTEIRCSDTNAQALLAALSTMELSIWLN